MKKTLQALFLLFLLFNMSLKATEINKKISKSTDDYEERSNGKMETGSSDLEMTRESSKQTIGIRFNTLNIPKGATITNAYIQFTADETNTKDTNLYITTEDSSHASTFSTNRYNISSRLTINQNIFWNVAVWDTIGEQSAAQKTPDLKSIIQPIINKSEWHEGNAIVFIITGDGKRVAESYEGSRHKAAKLHIEFTQNNQNDSADLRRHQHGLSFLKQSDGDYLMIWSSDGNGLYTSSDKDLSKNKGDWFHDIYYSYITPSNPNISPNKLISTSDLEYGKRAQEPASAAMSKNGNVMITFEDQYNQDGGGDLYQRYGVYNEDLSKGIKAYTGDDETTIFDGGHSGHVASVGNKFVAFYSDGWTYDNKGYDGLGTGEDVNLAVYDSNGKWLDSRDVSTQVNGDWWPLVAGSNTTAMLLWQRYVKNKEYVDLMMSIYDPKNNRFIKSKIKLQRWVKYYTYSIKYLPKIKRFLVMGTYHDGGGFGILIDKNGNVISQNHDLPNIVRESASVIRESGSNSYMVAQAREPNGIMTLRVTKNSIQLKNEVAGNYNWQYAGTDGVWKNDTEVYMVSLSTKGIVKRIFNAFK